MITGLDHIVLAVRDLGAAREAYQRLLGVQPDSRDGDGARRCWFRFAQTSLELISPDGEGAAGDRVQARLDAAGEGLWALAFATPDVAALAQLLTRRGLRTERLSSGAAIVDAADTAGIQIFLVEPTAAAASPALDGAPVAGLDHVVIQTANVDRSLAVLGAKLGLDLRLDRVNAGWGARQLFFRAGEALVEVAAGLKTPTTDASDTFGGLAWRVADPDAAQARLAATGFNVSEVRVGRKPGTKVFTVRDAPGAATIMISAEPPPEPR